MTKKQGQEALVAVSVVAVLLLLSVSSRMLPKGASPDVPAPVRVEKTPDGAVVEHYGYEPHPGETQEFLRSLPQPTIRDAGPNLNYQGAGDGEPVLLYRALYDAYREYSGGQEWKVGKQGIGDCVSWGWAHGADIHLAVMKKLGDTSVWKPAATESIYGGSRVEARGRSSGGWSDGSYGSAAAKWCKDFGIVFRSDYTDFGHDLQVYSSQRAKQWGNYGNGGEGDSGKFDEEAKKHPIKNVALVTTFDEAAAAIEAGYPVPVCSGQGFSSTRDADGFARAQGSWSHCMAFTSVRYDRRGLLCQNSWGAFNSGPKWPEDQPDGSFWVEESVVNRMLSGRDSFAVSGYEGFPYRNLKHGDWVQVKPRGKSETIFAIAP